MAEIYLARTRGLGGFEKYVALKMIHPNFSADEHFIQMLVDEAKITVQLQHVNIAQVFDLGRVGETYYITMEFVDGCDLYKVLRKASEQDRPMPIEIAVHVAREVANGLDYAHRKRDDTGKSLGIVHRDISPQNVLLSHAAEVKLVDFGIAKAAMRARQTAVGVIKGKYYYMSPEQAWGDPVDHRTDIFSAGILLYEMLTGQMLYLEEDLHRLLDMVRKADIALPSTRRPDVPSELERIVMKALAKKPEARWQSAHDFGAALERFLHSRAPDFTTSRLSTFMAAVLADEKPNIPPPRPTPEPMPAQDPARITRGIVDRGSIISSRAELSDDNSVIFRPSDLAARARKVEGAGRPTKPIQPPVGHPAASPVRQSRLPHAATPHVLNDDSLNEQTIISGPPQTFDSGIDPDTPMQDDPLTLDMMLDPPTGPMEGLAEEGTTRIDIGVTGAPRLADPDDSDDTNETTQPPTLRPPLRDLGLKGNPSPAVSALRKPRDSKKTPHQGVSPPSKVHLSPSLAPLAKNMPSPSQAPTMPAQDDDEVPTISPDRGRGAAPNGPTKPVPAPTKPVPAPTRPVQMAKPPGSFRPPSAPAPSPPAKPPPRPLDKDDPAGAPTQAADVEPAGLNWVFDPEPARAFQPMPGPPAAVWSPPTPTPPRKPAANGALAPEIYSDPAVYSLAPAKGKRWRTALMVLAFVIVAGGVAVGVAMVASRESPSASPTQLEVISIPPGAEVTVDGQRAGVTPLMLDKVEPGKSYKLTVVLAKHEKWERQEVVTEKGRTVKVIAALKPIFGVLHIETIPPGAEVYLGPLSQPLGQTPLTKDNIDPFTDVDIEVRLKGYKPDRRRVQWEGQRERTLSFKLVPSN